MTKYFVLCLALIVSTAPVQAGTSKKIVTENTFNYEVNGWEKPLVSRDANLGRWYWGAMECTGRRRSATTITTGDKNKPAQRICYVKPVHLALPVAKHAPAESSVAPTIPAKTKLTRSYGSYSKQSSTNTQMSSKLSGSLLNIGVRAEIKKL